MFNNDHRVMPAMMAAMMNHHYALVRPGRLYYRYARSGKKYHNCD
jgi:hypothetical protein